MLGREHKKLMIVPINNDKDRQETLYLFEGNEVVGTLLPLEPLSVENTKYYQVNDKKGEIGVVLARDNGEVHVALETGFTKEITVKNNQVIITFNDKPRHVTNVGHIMGSSMRYKYINEKGIFYHSLTLGQIKCNEKLEVPLIYLIGCGIVDGKEVYGLDFYHENPPGKCYHGLTFLPGLFSSIETNGERFLIKNDEVTEPYLFDYAIEYLEIKKRADQTVIFPRIHLSNIFDPPELTESKFATLFFYNWSSDMERCYLVDDERGLKKIVSSRFRRNGTWDAWKTNEFSHCDYTNKLLVDKLKRITYIPNVGYVCEQEGLTPNTIRIKILSISFRTLYKSDEDVLEIKYDKERKEFAVTKIDGKSKLIITSKKIEEFLYYGCNPTNEAKPLEGGLEAYRIYHKQSLQNTQLLTDMGLLVSSTEIKEDKTNQFVHQYPSDKNS